MKPIEYRHTLAFLQKTKEDLSRIAYISRRVVQVVRILYYGFAIYRHYESIPFLVIYCVLLLVSILIFAENLLYYNGEKAKEEKEKHKKRHEVLKAIGLRNKIALLVVSLIPVVQGKASDFDKVLILCVALLIFAQSLTRVLIHHLEKYSSWLKEALELDYKESLLARTPSRTFSDKLHDFARNLTGEKKNTPFQEELDNRIRQSEEEKAEKRKIEKQQRKDQRKKDISRIVKYYSDKHTSSKYSDEKLEKAVSKKESEAEKLLSDKEKLDAFLKESETEIASIDRQSGLSRLKDFLLILKSEEADVSFDTKKARLRNLLYYHSPLVPNRKTTEDNLKFLQATENRIILPEGDKK